MKADGQQGYFLQRMTPTYASSNGRLDIWWDNRSDFNANGEKAVFFGAMYDMKNWDMPGWAFGASYVYAWDAKPGRMSSPDAYYDPDYRLKESAYSLGCNVYRTGRAGEGHPVQTALYPIRQPFRYSELERRLRQHLPG